MLQVDLTDDPIDVSRMLSRVASKRAGAAVLFTGTTRQETDGLATDWLEYDAYKPLARRRTHSAVRTSCSQISNSEMLDRTQTWQGLRW